MDKFCPKHGKKIIILVGSDLIAKMYDEGVQLPAENINIDGLCCVCIGELNAAWMDQKGLVEVVIHDSYMDEESWIGDCGGVVGRNDRFCPACGRLLVIREKKKAKGHYCGYTCGDSCRVCDGDVDDANL